MKVLLELIIKIIIISVEITWIGSGGILPLAINEFKTKEGREFKAIIIVEFKFEMNYCNRVEILSWL